MAIKFLPLLPYFIQPSPELSPEQVIKIQLKGLKNNDSSKGDTGIAAAFVFASPANKAYTGPLERFIRMVKNPLYSSILNYESATFYPIQIMEDRAEQRVILIDTNGNEAVYLFCLSRQYIGEYMCCWMTDSVIRE